MTSRRLRRKPSEARDEILKAAESALQEGGLDALTVELLMERTGMTRSSFYHYFKSLDAIVMALFEHVEAEVSGAVDDWLEGEDDADPRAASVDHLTRMFDVWREHANLMRAMEQASGRGGVAYGLWRGRVVDGYITKTTDFIRRQIAHGRSQVQDPEGLANALILMNVSIATDQALREEPDSPARLGAVAGHVWNASIYGGDDER